MANHIAKISFINPDVRQDKNGRNYITYKTGSYINDANQLVPGQYFLLYDEELFSEIKVGMEVVVG